MFVELAATTAPHTSCVPRTVAVIGDSPSEWRRKMFSSTTIALSMNMPTANAKPARLITLSERPIKFRITNVPMMLTGIARPDDQRAAGKPEAGQPE